MTDNQLVAKLQEEAATVLARLVIENDTSQRVIRIGVMDIISEGFLYWKFLLVFVKDPETIRSYADLMVSEVAGRYKGVDFNGTSHLLLLPWVDTEDMVAWVKDNYKQVFDTKLVRDKPMTANAWASQLAGIEVIIVPGAGMAIDEKITTAIACADIHQTSRELAGTTVLSIYNEAHRGRDGKNTQAIIGPRHGVRFFDPLTSKFEA